jgi:uncharacterized protein YdeI (BOF family)
MENNTENKNPNFWEKLKLWQKIVIIVIGISIIAGIIGSLGGNDDNYNETISIVTKGYFNDYPDVAVGKAFNNFFSNPKWENFVSDDGEQIVEFDGEASLDDENVLVEIQFIVDKSNGMFEVCWLGVDGESQSDYETNDWIDTAYEYYYSRNRQNNSSDSVSQGNNVNSSNNQLFLVNDRGKFGYINGNGELVIDYRFSEAHPFSEGIALVVLNGQKTYIDIKGNRITNLPISRGESFSEGLAAVVYDGKWGYIDTAGNLVIENTFEFAHGFSDGLALVQIEDYDGRAFIDKTGEVVIKLHEDEFYTNDIESFSDGLAYVKYRGHIGFIDKTGEIVIELSTGEYSSAHSFSDGLAWVHSINPRKVGYMDKTGQIVIEPKYNFESTDFIDGVAVVDNGGSDSVINKKGEILTTIQGDIYKFSDGVAGFYTGMLQYGFIDKTGNVFIEPKYNAIYKSFNNGLALVQLEDRLFYINKNEEIVWEF